jgi:phosphatidylglycerophosphate synthase
MMMESVKELDKICFRPNQKNNIYQKIAPYVTKILLLLHFNANQTSTMGFVLGVIASIFFISSNPLFYVIGGIFLFFVMVFDCCDGKIARYNKKEVGGLGGFFDWFGHQSKFLVILCLTFGLIGIFPEYAYPFLLFFGFISACFWFLNHTFFGLRKNLSKINKFDELDNKILTKISKTFKGRILKILIRFFSFFVILLKKFEIKSVDFDIFGHKQKNCFLYKIRFFIRRSQNGKIIPFIFIFSGIVDYFLAGPNYITFTIWIYLGVSSIILFFMEEFIVNRWKDQILV